MRAEKFVVVAEKASVARAIRSLFTGTEAKNVVVTAVRGHLKNPTLPVGYEWGSVNPFEIMKLRTAVDKVVDTRSYKNLVKLFRDDCVLVIATDNDSEGELIGFEVLSVFREVKGGEDVGCLRMRFNSLDRRELLTSWRNLEQGLNWRWVEKARFRQLFDLITGAAFTRLLTEHTRKRAPIRLISWGSCQTPTLNFIVEREREIIRFKPQKYWRINAHLETHHGRTFKAVSTRYDEYDAASKAYESVKNLRQAVVEEYVEERKVIPRPFPMRTDDVLRDLTRLTGVSASKLLNIMEDLYSEGYISYPRTDTNRYKPGFDFDRFRQAVEKSGIITDYSQIHNKPVPRNGLRDDGAHPPIYPTASYRRQDFRRKIWEYIARRFIANAYSNDAEQTHQKAKVELGELVLTASGSYLSTEGFYRIFPYFRPSDTRLPNLSKGEIVKVVNIDLVEGETKPPNRMTEDELLKTMEKHGIGTDATRASFPQLIVERNYARRTGKLFIPTPLGMKLIEALETADKRLVTADTRKLVEEYMMKIEQGMAGLAESLEKSLQLYEGLLETCSNRIKDISQSLAEAVKESQTEKKTFSKFRKKPNRNNFSHQYR